MGYRDTCACVMQDLAEQTRLWSFDFDRSLVRLDDQQGLAFGDLLSLLFDPGLDGGLFHI
jgi:hypothetical protein